MFKSKKRRKLKLSLFAGLILFIISQVVIVVIPYKDVPESFRPVYDFILCYRNKTINRLNLPVELYQNNSVIEVEGFRSKLFFAPSHKLQNELVNCISAAKESIEVCVFELNLPKMIEQLIVKHQQGVKVRVVIDADYQNEAELSPLYKAGIPLKVDSRSAFMHNKFLVIDGIRVWTGSQNFTYNCTFKNDNNALLIESVALAQNYQKEFDEMWNHGEGIFTSAVGFGQGSPANTHNPIIYMGKVKVENYFAPEDAVMKKIINVVRQARESVHVMAFSFTSADLARVLRRKKGDGIQVKVLFDGKSADSEHSVIKELQQDNIECVISSNRRGVMHHKVIIIDKKIVITGSFNFSENADNNNDENLLIIHSADLAKLYEEEFERCVRGIKGY